MDLNETTVIRGKTALSSGGTVKMLNFNLALDLNNLGFADSVLFPLEDERANFFASAFKISVLQSTGSTIIDNSGNYVEMNPISGFNCVMQFVKSGNYISTDTGRDTNLTIAEFGVLSNASSFSPNEGYVSLLPGSTAFTSLTQASILGSTITINSNIDNLQDVSSGSILLNFDNLDEHLKFVYSIGRNITLEPSGGGTPYYDDTVDRISLGWFNNNSKYYTIAFTGSDYNNYDTKYGTSTQSGPIDVIIT